MEILWYVFFSYFFEGINHFENISKKNNVHVGDATIIDQYFQVMSLSTLLM
jgi:hypothetical protein